MKSSIILLSACLFDVYNSCFTASIEEEIFNGTRAVKGQFPFDVLLELYNMEGRLAHCTGFLISDNWVMTAAHCCKNMKYMTINAGFVDRQDMVGAQKFNATNDKFHIFPQYDDTTLNYGICVVKLPSAIKHSKYVGIINLPPKSDAGPNTYEGKIATASGWGIIHDGLHEANRYLLFKDVKVMSYANCKKTYKNDLNNKMICTDKSTHGGPCPGDSGSALIINGVDGKPEAIGIVSYGTTCESKDPVVYTHVADYLDWIKNVTAIAVK